MRVLMASVVGLMATTAWADAPAFHFVQLTSISREAKQVDSFDSEKNTEKGYAINASFTAGTTFYFPVGIESLDYKTTLNGNTLSEAKETILSAGIGIRFVTTPNSALFLDYRKLRQDYNDQDDDGYDDDDTFSGRSQRAGWRWMPGDTVELMYMQQRDTWSYGSTYTEKTRTIGVRLHLSQSLSLGYQQTKLTNDDYWDSAEGREIDIRFGF